MSYSNQNTNKARDLDHLYGGLGSGSGTPVLDAVPIEEKPHTFTWDIKGVTANSYRHKLGTSPNASDVHDSGWIGAAASYQTSKVVIGAKLYRTLEYRLGNGPVQSVTSIYGGDETPATGALPPATPDTLWNDDALWDDNAVWG